MRERLGTLKQPEFVEALCLIESYVLRRAVCGYQTRNYCQMFANLSYKVGEETPLRDLRVEFARLRDSYRSPVDEEFERELKEGDLYGLRVCRGVLDGLEIMRLRSRPILADTPLNTSCRRMNGFPHPGVRCWARTGERYRRCRSIAWEI
jgi:hypothetical protein